MAARMTTWEPGIATGFDLSNYIILYIVMMFQQRWNIWNEAEQNWLGTPIERRTNFLMMRSPISPTPRRRPGVPAAPPFWNPSKSNQRLAESVWIPGILGTHTLRRNNCGHQFWYKDQLMFNGEQALNKKTCGLFQHLSNLQSLSGQPSPNGQQMIVDRTLAA